MVEAAGVELEIPRAANLLASGPSSSLLPRVRAYWTTFGLRLPVIAACSTGPRNRSSPSIRSPDPRPHRSLRISLEVGDREHCLHSNGMSI
jgi:hypothetical protein